MEIFISLENFPWGGGKKANFGWKFATNFFYQLYFWMHFLHIGRMIIYDGATRPTSVIVQHVTASVWQEETCCSVWYHYIDSLLWCHAQDTQNCEPLCYPSAISREHFVAAKLWVSSLTHQPVCLASKLWDCVSLNLALPVIISEPEFPRDVSLQRPVPLTGRAQKWLFATSKETEHSSAYKVSWRLTCYNAQRWDGFVIK